MAIDLVSRFIQHLANNPEHHPALQQEVRTAFDQEYSDTRALGQFVAVRHALL